ncbi:DUF4153 domain-containing protein [Micromonospora coxensis]|uniref:Uncharacterized protein n=1 Tax=Micromonospora coxensis TaxID=356852 RepID=A0A1C5JBD5_9ACTN|nr:DUF4173 domain-containing protein [Micromonospora coxensis]SCG67499.1 protein of unknown function [Micromonospora coxensis]
MSEPPPTPDSPGGTAPAGGAGNPLPTGGTPYLLVMPTADGAPPSVVWPGQEGQPAWAIPVTVPPGTQGYAVFVPLVPAAAPESPAPPVTTGGATDAADAPSAPPGAPTPTAASAGPVIPAQVSGAPTPANPAAADAGPTADAGPADAPAPTVGAGPADAPAPTTAGTGPADAPAPTTAGTGPAASAVKEPSAGGPNPVPSPRTEAATGPAVAVAEPALPVVSGARPGPLAAPPGARPMPQYGGPPVSWAPRPGPPPPSFLQTRWPGPEPATGWAVPAAVGAAALGVASFVPLSRVGIGWFLGWLVLTVAVVLGVRRRTAALPRSERLVRAGWAGAALALLAVLAFRNAWWLVTFCVLGALGCAALAIVGGRLLRSILFSLVAAPFAALRGLPWVRRHVTTGPDTGAVRRVLWSVVATVLVLLVFGGLLSSADAAFSEVLGAIVPEINVGSVFRWLFLAAVGGLIAVAAVYTLAAPPDLSTVDKPGERRFGILEWAPAIAALTALFGGFVAVQFTVLFGGQRHVLRTAGLSYAEYARSGFWQLVVVTLLTLAVLGGVTRWARRDTPAERTLLRVLLGLISVLSVVIVISALSRMYAYQKVYSFTGERIFVMAFELLLGAVFLMVLAAGVRWRGRWIPGVTVALAVAMLLSLAVLNPEDYAARRNVARYEQTGKIDAWYLRALSADATPALATLPDRVRRCTLSWIDDDLDQPDPWYAWNLGRARARAELDRLGPGAAGGQKDCKAADQFDLPKTRTPR